MVIETNCLHLKLRRVITKHHKHSPMGSLIITDPAVSQDICRQASQFQVETTCLDAYSYLILRVRIEEPLGPGCCETRTNETPPCQMGRARNEI